MEKVDRVQGRLERTSTSVATTGGHVAKMKKRVQKAKQRLRRSSKLTDTLRLLKDKRLRQLSAKQQYDLTGEVIDFCETIVGELGAMETQQDTHNKVLASLKEDMKILENCLLREVKSLHGTLLKYKDPEVSSVTIYGQEGISEYTKDSLFA